MTEPERRTDGLCAREGCGKKLPEVTKQMRKYAGNQIEKDPFCSAKCCRIVYNAVQNSPATSADHMQRMVVPCGTISAYRYGCRCESCKTASRDSARKRRAARQEHYRAYNKERMERLKAEPVTNHGAGGYRRGCRCPICTEAKAAYRREWNARQRLKAA